MALLCELRFAERGDEHTFVIFSRAVYLLPYRQLADDTYGLVWCRDCEGFGEGELFESSESLAARKAAIGAGRFSDGDRFLFARGEDEYRRWSRRWRASVALRRWRKSPPRCGRCFGASIEVIDDRNATHPATGERLDVHFLFGSTSVDFRVTVLSCEGFALGDIYGYDEAGRQINSSYPYDELMRLLENAGIEANV